MVGVYIILTFFYLLGSLGFLSEIFLDWQDSGIFAKIIAVIWTLPFIVILGVVGTGLVLWIIAKFYYEERFAI